MLIEVIVSAVIIMLVSLVGVLFIQKTARKFLEEKLSFLVAFSAGVFLMTAGAIGFEVFELAESMWLAIGLIISGYLLAWGLHFWLPETHHHHDDCCPHGHFGAKKLLVGDAIHNTADGIVLVTAFSASPALGVAVVMSIVIHEALQEISEFFVLRQAGYSTKKALFLNFVISAFILVGIGIGYFVLLANELELIFLGISVGFLLHVVIHDLLPKRKEYDSKQFSLHILSVVVGALIMGLISSWLTEDHQHGTDDTHYTHEEHGYYDDHDIHEEHSDYDSHDNYDNH